MKKLLISLAFIMLLAGYVSADCTVDVTLNVTDDPNAATQEVWYDPDNTVGGNETIQCSGDMTMAVCQFVIASPMVNDEVYVITKNGDGSESFQSASVPVGGIVGSTIITVITNCQ